MYVYVDKTRRNHAAGCIIDIFDIVRRNGGCDAVNDAGIVNENIQFFASLSVWIENGAVLNE